VHSRIVVDPQLGWHHPITQRNFRAGAGAGASGLIATGIVATRTINPGEDVCALSAWYRLA
jgi:hypothetical protein